MAPISPALDREVLEELQALDPEGSGDLLRRVADSYSSSSRELIETLRQAVALGDTESIGKAAHSLKSSSAHVGATNLASLCQSLEEMARRSSTRRTDLILTTLEPELERVHQALEEISGELDPSGFQGRMR